MSSIRKFGLIGYPLGHSFSQRFFSRKFEEENINAIYSNYEIAEVAKIIEILATDKNIVGFNVTIPHKEAILSLLNASSEEAQKIGAVNVVKVKRENKEIILTGYNSDVFGFTQSIKPLINKAIHHKALVLGTGGASKAIVFGLNKLGIETQLVSRSKTDKTISYNDLTEDIINQYKVIVNCTPLGTYPKVEDAPDLPYHLLGSQHLLYDLVYNPEETEFLKRGKEQEATIKNGLEMLELQAEEAWRIWNK